MDLSPNNTTRMEATLCKSVDTSTSDAVCAKSTELVTTNDNNGQIVVDNLVVDEKKPLLEEQSSLKLKRCRHGRIIVKDLSKKKLVQQDDRESNQLQSKSTTETKDETRQSNSIQSSTKSSVVKQNCEITVVRLPIDSTAPILVASTDVVSQNPPPAEFEKFIDIKVDKVREHKEKSPDDLISSKRISSKTPDRRRSRSKTSHRKQVSNRSPSHRKSPRRDRVKSPRRRDRSRSPRLSKSSSRRISSSRRRRSPRGESRTSPGRHHDRQSPRNRSPRRRRSRSRSGSRFISNSCGNVSRSPRREADDQRGSKNSRTSRRRDVFDTSSSDLNNQLITEVSKAVNSDKLNSSQLINSETLLTKQSIEPHEGSENASLPNHNHNDSQSNQLVEVNSIYKSSQQEVSPRKPLSAHSSLSPSTNNSASSDIYDPEGPILPISPGDSPPSLSSMNKAANNKKAYLIENERNDDDPVPSSAVSLNHQEKYLQKLNRQERVVEEVKLALKPHYQRRSISKDQYKEVLRRAVPKVSVFRRLIGDYHSVTF